MSTFRLKIIELKRKCALWKYRSMPN